MSGTGLLISFEGCEGSGKTTQADILQKKLESVGRRVVRTREPGGTKTGEIIRGILQHDVALEPIEDATEALLFAASRAQMVRQMIIPALEAGDIVISDRYIDSTMAYQGYGRELGPDVIASVNSLAIGDTMPDITFLLDVEIEEGMARIGARNEENGGEADRIEKAGDEFHERVRQGYLEIARSNLDRIQVIDGTLDVDVIANGIWGTVEEMLGRTEK